MGKKWVWGHCSHFSANFFLFSRGGRNLYFSYFFPFPAGGPKWVCTRQTGSQFWEGFINDPEEATAKTFVNMIVRAPPQGPKKRAPKTSIWASFFLGKDCRSCPHLVNLGPAPLQKCVGDFVVQILEDFAGDFPGGFL